ncbi:class I SAM-dependent methyltransferase [Actinophytocola gossypii]|uniref:Methyltransferase domain-containing protein n=1 Tax=Actinophytocola gossypii TaxID=2812003 RepID=A0ABT2JIK8_9PSEU|nr:class I SAM-dependent methyltransferase [Actinophytocola gossypii]MCT2587723.1 methyltransferase domain-containing protein [Actinophytocola gossypii]
MRNVTTSSNWSAEWWAEHDERYDALLAPMTRHLLAAAAIRPGERVVDVGCGCGNTTRLAGRAAPDGSALGVDKSPTMLAKAALRTEESGPANVRFVQADAQTHPFEPADVVLSQFGVMFFDDPVAAFANLRRAGGRLVFLCWQAMERNESRLVKRAALSPHVRVPPDQPGVGPASLADPDRIRGILTEAGYTGVELTDVREPLLVGPTADAACDFELGAPALAAAFAEAGPDAAARARDALRAAYADRETPDGVFLGYAAWLVTAG